MIEYASSRILANRLNYQKGKLMLDMIVYAVAVGSFSLVIWQIFHIAEKHDENGEEKNNW